MKIFRQKYGKNVKRQTFDWGLELELQIYFWRVLRRQKEMMGRRGGYRIGK